MTPWTVDCQAPLSMEFSRQEYWSGLSILRIILSLFSHSVMSDSLWPHGLQYTRLPCPSPSPEFAQTHIHWDSDAIQTSRPLLSPSTSIFNHFSIRTYPNELARLIMWPNYWSFSFSISLSNEYSGLISFRIDWFDLLAIQGTLKSILQHSSSKPSILRCSAFFIVQVSYPYMTTGKTIALTIWTFVGKVMSLLFNILSRLVIIFLPRSKRLLISMLQ